MSTKNDFREKMLSDSSYWVENINGLLYDAIVTYMEKHKMKRKDLAEHLGLSAGRVSQILNEGDTNFSIEKMVEIALKVDKIPELRFEDKVVFLEKEKNQFFTKTISMQYGVCGFKETELPDNKNLSRLPKVIHLANQNRMEETTQISLTY